MKIVKTASGKNKIKMSKSEWTNLGKKAGWLNKKAQATENATYQQPGAQPGAQPQIVLSNRVQFMIKKCNEILGSNVPLTEEGYNKAGRSQGIINHIANSPQNLIENQDFKNFFADGRYKSNAQKLIKDWFLSISNSG